MSKATICDACAAHIMGERNHVTVTIAGETDGKTTVFDYHRKCFPDIRRALRERRTVGLEPGDR